MAQIRVPVRVRPGSSRTKVGGSYGDDRMLVVAVTAPPVDGAANDAVIDAVARALGVPARRVNVRSGHTSRSKVLEVVVDDEDRQRLLDVVEGLRGGSRQSAT